MIESNFSINAIDLLKSETLEYVLLDSEDGTVVPVVTSLFYCNAEELTIIADDRGALTADVEALALHIAPMEQQIEYWKEYYEMSDEQIVLLIDLYEEKLQNIHSEIHLTDEQKKMLPGEDIDDECIVSFAEIGILVTN